MSIIIETRKNIEPVNISAINTKQKLQNIKDKKTIDAMIIVNMVSKLTNVTKSDFFHNSRCKAHIAEARQLAMYLLHVTSGRSMSEVGRFFGRDRTTVSHACAKIEDRRDDMEFDEFVAQLENKIFAILEQNNNDQSED